MGVAAIDGIVPGLGVFACRGIPLLADVANRQSCDGGPQRVVRREDAVIAKMRTSKRILVSMVIALAALVSQQAHGQSLKQGTVLIAEDFSSDTVDKTKFSNGSWSVPDTWELRDGSIACIYDAPAHPGKAHGKSIDPKFKARNARVSYRVRFQGESARLSMIINAGFPPVKTGLPVWHIADVNARLPRTPKDASVGISERDSTRDENDPRNTRKSHGPADIFKPLGAYEIRGISSTAKVLGTERIADDQAWYLHEAAIVRPDFSCPAVERAEGNLQIEHPRAADCQIDSGLEKSGAEPWSWAEYGHAALLESAKKIVGFLW